MCFRATISWWRALEPRVPWAYHQIVEKGRQVESSALSWDEWILLGAMLADDGYSFAPSRLALGGEVRYQGKVIRPERGES